MNRKKLLLNDRVEVRQFETGLRGSWHPGVVVGVSDLCRSVQYDELLSETGESNLIESIPVTDAIEGLHCRRYVPPTYRGHIRPQPSQNQPDSCKLKLKFGVCVDALFEDAWWEGVIFDHHDDADERSVFFPDEGDVRRFNVTNLRISHVWDEFLDVWRDRGMWILVELVRELEGDFPLSDYVKKIWSSLRRNYEFKKMISEWTCNVKTLWKKYFLAVLDEIACKSSRSNRNLLRASLFVKNQIKCSVIRKRYSVLRNPQSTSENIKGPSEEEEKKVDSSTADDVLTSEKIETPSQELEGGLHPGKMADDVLPSEEIKTPCQGLERGVDTVRIAVDVLPSKKIKTLSQELERGLYPTTTADDGLESERIKTSSQKLERELYSVKNDSGLHSKNCCWTQPFENSGQNGIKSMVPSNRKRKRRNPGRRPIDTICIVCHCPGDLILCNGCQSSYHLNCLELKGVPDENWYCPSCCCGLCGLRDSDTDNPHFTNVCLQCSREYHLECLKRAGAAGGLFPIDHSSGTLCSETCYRLCAYLHQILGTSNPTGVDDITWTVLRSNKDDCSIPGILRVNTCKKLSRALTVIHECFQPVVEPHTKRDLVKDVVYSSVSRLRRLNFRGFYVMALEKGDDYVSVATVRIHGQKVAEMPLIATNFKYRRQGMCRLLVHELEKLLKRMGVERLVLPAISQMRETWKATFGFQEISHDERLHLMGYPFLGFKGTAMFLKYLENSQSTKAVIGASAENDKGLSSSRLVDKSRIDLEGRFRGFVFRRKPNIRKENSAKICSRNMRLVRYMYRRRNTKAKRDLDNPRRL